MRMTPEVMGKKMTAANLQEIYGEADDRVATKAAGVDLIHTTLVEKGLDDENYRSKCREFLQIFIDHLASCHPVGLIHTNIDGKSS